MSTESTLAGRTIVIHQSGPNFFTVSEGDRRTVGGLTWDECIGHVAAMITARMGPDFDGFGMRTDTEIRQEAEDRAYAHAQRQLRLFERLLPPITTKDVLP